jgi:hypothetical protein
VLLCCCVTPVSLLRHSCVTLPCVTLLSNAQALHVMVCRSTSTTLERTRSSFGLNHLCACILDALGERTALSITEGSRRRRLQAAGVGVIHMVIHMANEEES